MSSPAISLQLTEIVNVMSALAEGQAAIAAEMRSIKECVQTRKPSPKAKISRRPSFRYTGVLEFRTMLKALAVDMASEYGHDRAINLVLIREEIRKRANFRPGDLELNKAGEPRWTQQLNNALYPPAWEDNTAPFVRADRRGYYRVARSGQMALAVAG